MQHATPFHSLSQYSLLTPRLDHVPLINTLLNHLDHSEIQCVMLSAAKILHLEKLVTFSIRFGIPLTDEIRQAVEDGGRGSELKLLEEMMSEAYPVEPEGDEAVHSECDYDPGLATSNTYPPTPPRSIDNRSYHVGRNASNTDTSDSSFGIEGLFLKEKNVSATRKGSLDSNTPEYHRPISPLSRDMPHSPVYIPIDPPVTDGYAASHEYNGRRHSTDNPYYISVSSEYLSPEGLAWAQAYAQATTLHSRRNMVTIDKDMVTNDTAVAVDSPRTGFTEFLRRASEVGISCKSSNSSISARSNTGSISASEDSDCSA